MSDSLRSDQQTSQDWDESAWASWAVGLAVPGIDPYDRIASLEAMRAQARLNRTRAITVLGGALFDIMDALPTGDWWRNAIDPSSFGTWRDGTDVMPSGSAVVSEDIGLATLAKPLSRGAAHLMAASATGWKSVTELADTLEDPIGELTRAITWATWRRYAYQGQDEWPVLAVFQWIKYAAALEEGTNPDDSYSRAREKREAKLSDDLL